MNLTKLVPFLMLVTFQANAATMVFHASKLSRQLQTVKQTTADDQAGLITELSFNLTSLDYNPAKMEGKDFTALKVASLTNSSKIGEPSLPFKAVIVPGTPADIEVSLDLGSEERLDQVRPAPAQKEKCRCELDNKIAFTFSAEAYNKVTSLYRIESIGDFRGVQYSRVIVSPASYDGKAKELSIYPSLKVSILSRGESKSSAFYANMQANEERGLYDYLMIAPNSLKEGLTSFIQFKRKFGHTIKLVSLEDIASAPGVAATSADVNKFIKAEYAAHKFTYALLVGTEKLLPTNYLKTSGDARTPSDSAYFIMGDATDIIPDVYHARLVAESLNDVKNQTTKWMAYENASTSSIEGFMKGIGIASNEGSKPSDNEYILSIEKRLKEKAGTLPTHFYQTDGKSTPANINAAFNAGALWAVYIGHGSGTAWPSTQGYNVSSIPLMNNVNQVKPVLIDVACQNGKLLKGNFGERLVNTARAEGPMGVTAYYGGTVDISWHPPAILARGVIYNYFDKGLTTLGESLFSGHIYLAENHSDKNELIYNWRWFHLFGDPSMRLRDSSPITSASVLSVKKTDHGNYILTKDGAPVAKATITFFDAVEVNSLPVITDDKGEFALSNQRENLKGLSHFYHWEKNQGLSKYSL